MQRTNFHSNQDHAAAGTLKGWLEGRTSERSAWKKVTSLIAAFGATRWTEALKNRIEEALAEAGIQTKPPLSMVTAKDTVQLDLARSGASMPDSRPAEDPGEWSAALPNQIAAWHAFNINDDGGSEDPDFPGQYLWCLKSTCRGDRMFVWEASSGRGIVGIVTFGESGFCEGRRYARWGHFHMFPEPISREQLLTNPETTNRFCARGIKALQGSAIRLAEGEARAITTMLGDLGSTPLPKDLPSDGDPITIWSGRDGLIPESFTEGAIFLVPRLQRALGLQGQPARQVRLRDGRRVDLLQGNTIIEVKRSVGVNDGPDQIEDYLKTVGVTHRISKRNLRGVLVQQKNFLAPGIARRMDESPYRLELWAVYRDDSHHWQAERLH